jgi:hypothetical protein
MCVLYVFSLLTALLPSCSLAWLFSEMVNQLNALSCLAGDPEDHFLKLASKRPSSARSPSQGLSVFNFQPFLFFFLTRSHCFGLFFLTLISLSTALALSPYCPSSLSLSCPSSLSLSCPSSLSLLP